MRLKRDPWQSIKTIPLIEGAKIEFWSGSGLQRPILAIRRNNKWHAWLSPKATIDIPLTAKWRRA